jgi:hypothetical protein
MSITMFNKIGDNRSDLRLFLFCLKILADLIVDFYTLMSPSIKEALLSKQNECLISCMCMHQTKKSTNSRRPAPGEPGPREKKTVFISADRGAEHRSLHPASQATNQSDFASHDCPANESDTM